MRREVAIVLGVLVPFGALVALGLWFSRDPRQPGSAAPPPSRVEPPAVSEPRPGPPPLQAAPAPLVETARPRDGGPRPADPLVPPELAVPLAAVTPEVLLCFKDQRAHLLGNERLEVAFTPLPDGGFTGVTVPATANPWLGACVEDVFEELGFLPTGAETFRAARHTFIFDASKD